MAKERNGVLATVFGLKRDDPHSVYRKNAKLWILMIMCVQALCVFLLWVEMWAIFAGFVMFGCVVLAYFVLRSDFEMHYVNLWGVASAACAAYQTFTGVFSFVISIFTLDIPDAIITCLCPLVGFLAAMLAWQLNHDHDEMENTFRIGLGGERGHAKHGSDEDGTVEYGPDGWRYKPGLAGSAQLNYGSAENRNSPVPIKNGAAENKNSPVLNKKSSGPLGWLSGLDP